MDAFDYQGFTARYPEFNTLSQGTVTAYFNESVIYLNSRISENRAVYLNMITAHICAIFSGINGSEPSGVVGRVGSATQGSVNVNLQYAPVHNDLQAWFNQTPYGAQYWAITAGYRTAFYIPGCSEAQYGFSNRLI